MAVNFLFCYLSNFDLESFTIFVTDDQNMGYERPAMHPNDPKQIGTYWEHACHNSSL